MQVIKMISFFAKRENFLKLNFYSRFWAAITILQLIELFYSFRLLNVLGIVLTLFMLYLELVFSYEKANKASKTFKERLQEKLEEKNNEASKEG